ncbi:MAG: phytanoyl-CoA dioxygenase family protein, partial [Planctomycetota bacterium]
HRWCKRTQYLVRDGAFHCGQVNVLLALSDIGPGDGATMAVPASHKAVFPHPDLERCRMRDGQMASVDGVRGAREVHLRAGDALLFVDALMHGSAERRNPGERRLLIQRYGPSWGRSRHGYQPSPELLARLTPRRRAIIHPQDALLPAEKERT